MPKNAYPTSFVGYPVVILNFDFTRGFSKPAQPNFGDKQAYNKSRDRIKLLIVFFKNKLFWGMKQVFGPTLEVLQINPCSSVRSFVTSFPRDWILSFLWFLAQRCKVEEIFMCLHKNTWKSLQRCKVEEIFMCFYAIFTWKFWLSIPGDPEKSIRIYRVTVSEIIWIFTKFFFHWKEER